MKLLSRSQVFFFLGLGLLCVAGGLFTIDQRLKKTETPQPEIQQLEDIFLLNEENNSTSTPENTERQSTGYQLQIPSIGVTMPISFSEDASVGLDFGAWHIPGSGKPNTKGYNNIIFGGHRHQYTSGPNTLFRLDEVEIGEEVQLIWNNELIRYRIEEKHIVSPDEISILEDTETPVLTIFTCHPVFTTDQRLVIRAMPL